MISYKISEKEESSMPQTVKTEAYVKTDNSGIETNNFKDSFFKAIKYDDCAKSEDSYVTLKSEVSPDADKSVVEADLTEQSLIESFKAMCRGSISTVQTEVSSFVSFTLIRGIFII